MKSYKKAMSANFIFLILIFACRQVASDSQNATNLKGTWIYLEYKKVGINTRSPSRAFSDTFDEGPNCLLFDENITVPFQFGSLFNPHVGGGGNMAFKYSPVDSNYYVGSASRLDYKLKFKIVQKDTFLIMTENRKLNYEKVFVKISNKIQKEPYLFFFQNYVFSGKYSVFDSSGIKLPYEARFEKDGTLKSFESFQKYDIDFNPEYHLDVFSFHDGDNKEFEFIPEYDGSKLNLFEIIFNQDRAIKGSLRYILIKNDP